MSKIMRGNEILQGYLKVGVCMAAVAIAAIPGAAIAQVAPPPNLNASAMQNVDPVQKETADQAAPARDIVVTGTRIIRDGYNAPTPVSVIGAADIAAKAPVNLADFVNQFPELAGSTTPRSSVGGISAGNSGVNALNLRNLGVNRTLVLLDGQRVGASTISGLVDINQLPQALVKRVDVITGGASADWGSDAVAGVVNFVLDKDFTGIKGDFQGGVTTYGDDRSYKASLAAGAKFADGRGHILLSAEVAHNDGIQGIGSRSWYNYSKVFTNPNYTATNGQPQLLVRPNSGFATATPGGIITSGPLKGTYFGQGGTPTQFNYGSPVGGNVMQGGQYQYADFGTTTSLDPRISRQNAFFRTSYDVSDDIQLFAQVSYGRATSFAAFGDQYNFGNITVQKDNAFLPASVAAQMTALNLSSITIGTLNQDLGPITTQTTRSSWRPVIGANGKFDAFGSSWAWDAYAQKSITNSYVASNVSITANYNAAIDSVRNASGAVVCRSTLTNPNNGCVPYDIFGTGVNGQAALNYVLGTAWLRSKITEDVYSATLHGNPLTTWAGPVSVALGLEHRREAVSGSNDPLSSSRSYWAGNYQASSGSYDVTEGFFETVVPLAKDAAFAKSLDLNAAVRGTSYSTSGYVTTWKAGLTYKPIDDITFRVTRSRDIRAPNLAEAFQANQTTTTTVTDPQRALASATIFQVTSGNASLQPEKADSWGVGAVFQPRFLPGFQASVDYYSINIKNAISTLVAQTLINQCASGNQNFCSAITRNASGVITQVQIQPINLSTQRARGIDFEASYRRPLLGGTLTLRGLATRYLENLSDNGINIATDNVGTNYGNGSNATSLPTWSFNASIGLDMKPISLLVTARGFSAGVYNTSYIECTSNCPAATTDHQTIENNKLPGATYFDMNVTYSLMKNVEVFLSMDNIFDKDPAQVPWTSGGAPLSVNPSLYDTLGRTFRTGIRFKV